jgi:hypothetical protein
VGCIVHCMTRTREQAMKAEQTARALRHNDQLLDLIDFLELADMEEHEELNRLERT